MSRLRRRQHAEPFAPRMIGCATDFPPSRSIAGLTADAPTRTRMNDEAALRDKLRKIEALFSGAGTAGEKAAAAAAADRIRTAAGRGKAREAGRDALQPARSMGAPPVHRAVPPVWHTAVPVSAHATAKRNSSGTAGFPRHSAPARVPGDQRRAGDYLAQVTDRVIREAVYKDTADAEEVAEPEKFR